jgi:hypothetical protein
MIAKAARALLVSAAATGWVGIDPFDGLRSPLFWRLPVSGLKRARQAWIQFFKRCPVNLRPLFGIAPGQNAKGVAVFLRAACDLARLGPTPEGPALRLLLPALRSRGYAGVSWGYDFPWQSRAFFVPAGVPNAVCTVFAGHALLDWHEAHSEDAEALILARDAGTFLLTDLGRTPGSKGFCFSYTPVDRSCVHNVNVMVAGLLTRLARRTGEGDLVQVAQDALRFTVAHQAADGSWPYGTRSDQRWIDGFHTGYVLTGLVTYARETKDDAFAGALQRGYEFFDARFFGASGRPRYYHDRDGPVDVHCAAQGILTYLEAKALDPQAEAKASRIADWALRHLWDPRGHFVFQRGRLYTIRIPYQRWAQAWMCHALARLGVGGGTGRAV